MSRREKTQEQINQALQALSSMVTSSIPKTSAPVVPKIPGSPVTTEDEDLNWLIGKESSGRTNAKNPKSTAFGLGQLLVANRKAYAAKLGIANPDTTDYDEQLAMMKTYIKDRYGSSKAAREFHQKRGWY